MQIKSLNRSCEVGEIVEYRTVRMVNAAIPAKKGKIISRDESFAFNATIFGILDEENDETILIMQE